MIYCGRRIRLIESGAGNLKVVCTFLSLYSLDRVLHVKLRGEFRTTDTCYRIYLSHDGLVCKKTEFH